MSRIASLLITTTLVVASVLLAGDKPEKKGTADADLSLSRTSVFETPAPEAVLDERPSPGESDRIARAHAEMPPPVSHDVREFLPILRGENACIDCHAIEEYEPGEPVPLPTSHYVDFRNAPGKTGDEVDGTRFVCLSCHVAQTAARPLAANSLYETKLPAEKDEGEEADPPKG
jgi:cytochrome c-type protein NapB